MSGFMRKVQLAIDEVPQNIDAEKSVISCIIRNPELFFSENMPVDFFFDQTNKGVYAAICDLASKHERILASTIRQRFDTNRFSNAGLNDLMKDLSKIVVDPSSFKDHARSLKESFIKRQLHINGNKLRELAHRNDEGSTLVQIAADLVSNIKIEEKSDDCVDGLDEYFDQLNQDIVNGKTPEDIMPTGFRSLDEILKGGIMRGDYIVIGAASSAGKTTLAMQFGWQMSMQGRHVFVFSAESGKKPIMDRSISLIGQVDAGHIRQRSMYTDMDGVIRAQEIIKRHIGVNMFIDYTPQISVQNMKAKLAQHIAKHGVPDVIIVDYLQYLKQDVRCNSNTMVDVVRQTTKDLKDITRTYKTALIALSQLNMDGCKEGEQPSSRNLAECPSQIWRDADIVMLLHTIEKFTPIRHRMKLIVDKGRDTGTGDCYFEALRNLMRFIEDNGAPVKPIRPKDLSNEDLVKAVLETKSKLPTKKKIEEEEDNEAHPFVE